MLRKHAPDVTSKLQDVAENIATVTAKEEDRIDDSAAAAAPPTDTSDKNTTPLEAGKPRDIVRVGIIGCGEVTQVLHIPTLLSLSSYFCITYICDISTRTLSHVASTIPNASLSTTTSADELVSSSEVDAVLVASYDAFHYQHTITALENDKHVLSEKPLSYNTKEIDAIIDAEKRSKGKVFVGTMRRYSRAFQDVVREVGGMEKVLYARIRDIIGPNKVFVEQSGVNVVKEEIEDKQAQAIKEAMLDEGLGTWGIEGNEETRRCYWLLGNLGAHSISGMREILGMPQRCIGAYLGPSFSNTSNMPSSPLSNRRTSFSFSKPPPEPEVPKGMYASGIWSALFAYPSFSVTYESGFTSVPVYDSHVEIYSEDKIVRLNLDASWIRGLPTTMTVREKIPGDDGGCQERHVRRTYKDSYHAEWLEFYDVVKKGKEVKTSAEDARWDLEVWGMVVRAAQRA